MKNRKLLNLAAGALAVLGSVQTLHAAERPQWSGDFRARVQVYRNRLNAQQDVEDAEVRLRAKADYRLNPHFTVQGRIVGEAASMPNLDMRLQRNGDTVGYELSLDRAFLQWKGQHAEVRIGEFDHPLAKTTLHIDKDMPAVGISARWQLDNFQLEAFYDVGRQVTQDTKSRLIGLQVSGEKKGKHCTLGGSLGYHRVVDFDTAYRLSNSPNAEFSVAHAAINFTMPKGPTRLSLGYAHNTDMTEENGGFMIGLKIGEAHKPRTFSGSISYAHIERDALLAGITPRDSPRTNIDTVVLRGDYRFGKNNSIYLFSGNPKHLVPASPNDTQRQHVLESGIEFRF